ncbi:hypothetical protein QTP70_009381 [Hemibagrus guttatus]|uniref:ribonuclease H n=1 Tax=Hemibagrus guttatus TaxID=175788 RepID=A0AAE0UQN6_9TELE|nr:hypothetical protein QTP70_009381 [Hemibagrus guttatus]
MDQLSEEVRQESPWTMMFADDIVICNESREQVEENLERWRFALERRGMKVSRSKTEYMCVNEREGSGTVRLQGEEVKKVQEFKYLGSTVQSNGECGKEVKKRVQAGWNGWRKVSGVLCDRKISARIKGKVYRTVVRPAMLYGLETVSLRKRQESELEVAELKMLRFSLGVTRLDRIRNEYIRGTAHVGRLGDKVREARLRWFGHVQRRDSEYIGRRMLDMELPGRRQRGRPKRREKANLAVTISTPRKEVLAHAAFVDHPIGDLVDQASWEQLLQTHFNATKFTPLNTIFLHLFVAQPGFAISSAKEIIRTVFNAITELEYICLVTPYSSSLEPALMDIFEPMPCVTDEFQCGAFVCHRHNYCPRLHVRRARVEDLIDLTNLKQMKTLGDCWPAADTLAEKIEAEDKMNHVAVFENDGFAVGFIIVSGKFNLLLLNTEYELGPFDGLKKKKAEKQSEVLDQSPQTEPTDDISDSQKPSRQSEVKEFSITYCPCSEKADSLSRQHKSLSPPITPDPILPPSFILAPIQWNLLEEIQQAHTKETKTPPTPPLSCPPSKLYVLSMLCPTVLQWVHEAPSSGHQGICRNNQLVHNQFWWPTLAHDIEEYIKSCSTCAQAHTSCQLPEGLFEPLPIPQRRWSHISIDFLTDLPNSKGFTTILVAIDRFSKACRLICLSVCPLP